MYVWLQAALYTMATALRELSTAAAEGKGPPNQDWLGQWRENLFHSHLPPFLHSPLTPLINHGTVKAGLFIRPFSLALSPVERGTTEGEAMRYTARWMHVTLTKCQLNIRI